jgi:2-keto-3-deoxy-L-rhamnonate aldolase RhmA
MSEYFTNKAKIGSWITLPSPSIAEIMAKSGFDWLAVDLEHSVINISQAEDLIRTIDLCGIKPFVRLTSNDKNQIKRVMDSGAHGIIVPMINSLSDLEYSYKALKYPPSGNRGVGLARAQGYGRKFNQYLDWQSSKPLLIAQIEHIDAVENIEEIFSYEHLDAFIIGPYDLSGSLGSPGDFDNPDFINAISRIEEVSKNLDIPKGIHVIEPNIDEVNHRIQEGYKMIAYSLDIRMLDSQCKALFDNIKG